MTDGSISRQARHSRPSLEGLEGRQLLSGAYVDKFGNWHNLVIHDKDLSRWQRQHTDYVAPDRRRFAYTTPDGAKVMVTLYGSGNLDGTFVDPDGALNVRFAETNSNSGIVARVTGGHGHKAAHPLLRSIQHSALPVNSISGVGSSLVRVVNFKDFDLVPGGRVNLTGGVQTFMLNSVGPNTSVQLREIPASILYPTTSTTSANQNGVTLGFAVDLFGAQTLTSTSGQFLPGANLLPTAVPTKPNKPLPPPGVVAVINHVNGASRQTGLGDPNLYAYDPNSDALIRFDIQAVPVNGGKSVNLVGSPTIVQNNVFGAAGKEAGTSLGRYNGRLVVLVSDGNWLKAYNALDGTFVGQSDLSSLHATMPNPARLGNVDSFTVIGDPNAGNPSTTNPADKLGTIQIIDVTKSIDTGNVVTVGKPFSETRDLGLSGGWTGIPGGSTLFAGGGAFFDTFQPNQPQVGLASLSPSGSTSSNLTFTEAARNALTSGGNKINATNLHGATAGSKNDAIASLNLAIGVVTGNTATTNTITLFSPTSFAATGRTITLNYGGVLPLSGITSVYYPQLVSSALVDIQGNTQSFRSVDAIGLVLNDTGNLNLVKMNSAVDTTIAGAPFGHAQIPHRENVSIVSTARTVGDRNGVVVLPSGVLPVGPLTLP